MLLRLLLGTAVSGRYRLDLRTCFDLDTQRTTPQFFVACVRTCDAEHLACPSRFAVAFGTVAFATSHRVAAAFHSACTVTTSPAKQTELRALITERAPISSAFAVTFAFV
jgi:hypothetical protein